MTRNIFSLLDEMLVHSRVTPSVEFAGTHLYTWVERGAVRVKCLAQEHNAMSRPGFAPGELTEIHEYLIAFKVIS